MREPRLTTVMGVARAVIATVGPRDAARALIDEFGWDVSFQALALLRGEEAAATFGAAWSILVLDATADEVDDAVAEVEGSAGPEHWHPSLGPGSRDG